MFQPKGTLLAATPVVTTERPHQGFHPMLLGEATTQHMAAHASLKTTLNKSIRQSLSCVSCCECELCASNEVDLHYRRLSTKMANPVVTLVTYGVIMCIFLQQNKPEGHSECAHEALNTKLFLALEAPTGTEKEDNFIPVFETQVSECGHDRDSQHLEQSEKKPDSLTDSFEVGYKDKAEDQFESSHCGVPKGTNKQKDFVKRNIELVNGEGGQVFLTQAEKERLAELLREIDEEEEDGARGADSEGTMWAVSVLTDQGYTPEPSDLEQLIDIDSKIHHLHPDKDFHSYTSSCTDLCMSQGPGSRVGWKCFGDLQPGEKVLQDIKERRGQERRLREIQQQLEILGQGQEMTDRLPDLTEEQLLSLLDECELTERCSQDLQTNHAAP